MIVLELTRHDGEPVLIVVGPGMVFRRHEQSGGTEVDWDGVTTVKQSLADIRRALSGLAATEDAPLWYLALPPMPRASQTTASRLERAAALEAERAAAAAKTQQQAGEALAQRYASRTEEGLW